MSRYDIEVHEIRNLWKRSGKYKEFRRLFAEEHGDMPGLATVFRWLRKAGIEPKNKTSELVTGSVLAPDETRAKVQGERFVFTCAQSGTEIHEEFFGSLLSYCKINNARLIVGKTTYGKEAALDSRVLPFVIDGPVQIAPDLVWCGELNIIPTNISPLSGLDSYMRGCSGIVPHTQVHMQSAPRLKYAAPRFMYTTGAVTRRNYVQRKAGQRAAFHHVFGALVVEKDGDDWFARQLVANNTGNFYDLDTFYTSSGSLRCPCVEAINLGDLHAGRSPLQAEDLSVRMGIHNMLEELNPLYVLLHDSLDFRARNHHNIDDPYVTAMNYMHGNDCVRYELDLVAECLNDISNSFDGTLVVVESNHDLALKRWLSSADFRKDPKNAIIFLELQKEIYSALQRMDPNFSVFEHAMKERGVHGKFLREDQSFRICDSDGTGIECGMHGHRGLNGSRGTPRQFTRLGVKCNTGHTHTAGIIHGVYTAGVSCSLDLDYNVGPTTWSNSHIITYTGGKRAIITQRGAKWKA